jgi:hypothetical protein
MGRSSVSSGLKDVAPSSNLKSWEGVSGELKHAEEYRSWEGGKRPTQAPPKLTLSAPPPVRLLERS